MKTLKLGLATLCLTLLCACSAQPIVTEYQTVKLTPPGLLLAECLGPELPAGPMSNLELLQYAIELKLTLDECNQTKARLREFYNEPAKNSALD